VQYAHGPRGILAENTGGWRYHQRDQDGSLIGVTDDDGRRVVEFDYQPFGTPVRREVVLDITPSEVTDVEEHTPILTSTRIHVSVTLTAGALAGRELAIAVPGASADRYRTAAVLTNGAGTIDVHDPQGLIADALINEDSGLVVYASKLSVVAPVWTYNSISDTSTFTVAGAGFSSWLLGGHLTPDITRPAYFEIIDVDSLGNWLRVRGDARGMSGSGDHYRALPPVGVDSEGGYTAMGERYLYRGYRHDPAPRIADWPDADWANRSGTYTVGGRTLDPRIGRWITPAATWRNPYAYAPWGTLDDVSPTGAPGLRGTWSPSPACPTRLPGQLPSRFAAPGLPGWSG
jgi:hypothetical protein